MTATVSQNREPPYLMVPIASCFPSGGLVSNSKGRLQSMVPGRITIANNMGMMYSIMQLLGTNTTAPLRLSYPCDANSFFTNPQACCGKTSAALESTQLADLVPPIVTSDPLLIRLHYQTRHQIGTRTGMAVADSVPTNQNS